MFQMIHSQWKIFIQSKVNWEENKVKEKITSKKREKSYIPSNLWEIAFWLESIDICALRFATVFEINKNSHGELKLSE